MFNFLRRTSLYIVAIPLLFTFLGAASNQLVLIANHDTFPVMVNSTKLAAFQAGNSGDGPLLAPGMLDDTHCIMTKDTHLNFLADIFDFEDGVYSIGDLSSELGAAIWPYSIFIWAFAVIRKLQG
jgi:hypothetical protein